MSKKDHKWRHILLLFFNKTDGDLIWGMSLDEIMAASKETEFFSIDVHHILSQDPDWKGYKGRINEELLKALVPPVEVGAKRLVGICGPILFTRESQRYFAKTFPFWD
jgi:NAD(P)H-flavin reductase